MAEKAKIQPVAINEDETTTDVATTEGAEAPAVSNQMAMGEVSGEVGASDIKFPTLRIIQKMSDNPDKLDEGLVTLDNTMIIGNAKNVARIVFLSFTKYYREVLAFGAGMPQNFATAEQAVAEGFRVARSKADRDAGVPLVEDAARAVVLIEQPEGATDRGFPYELDGKRYTICMWWIQASAYASAAKYFFSKRAFELKGTNLLKAIWTLSSDEKKGQQGVYYTPALRLLPEENSDAFITQANEQIKL